VTTVIDIPRSSAFDCRSHFTHGTYALHVKRAYHNYICTHFFFFSIVPAINLTDIVGQWA